MEVKVLQPCKFQLSGLWSTRRLAHFSRPPQLSQRRLNPRVMDPSGAPTPGEQSRDDGLGNGLQSCQSADFPEGRGGSPSTEPGKHTRTLPFAQRPRRRYRGWWDLHLRYESLHYRGDYGKPKREDSEKSLALSGTNAETGTNCGGPRNDHQTQRPGAASCHLTDFLLLQG